MKAMKTITGVLLKVLDVLSIVLMVGMVVFLLIQLVARAVFTHGFFLDGRVRQDLSDHAGLCGCVYDLR